MEQGYRVCIEPRKMYSCGQWIIQSLEKVDALECVEDSSPEYVRVSIQDTAGVLDQIMYSQG